MFDSAGLHPLFACVGGFSDRIHVQSCIFLSTTTTTKLLSRAGVVLREIHVGSAPSPWHTCSSCAAVLHGLSSTTKFQFHSGRASQTRGRCCASQRLSPCSGPSAAQAAHRWVDERMADRKEEERREETKGTDGKPRDTERSRTSADQVGRISKPA